MVAALVRKLMLDSFRVRIGILLSITIIAVVAVIHMPPIAQDPSYHFFADSSTRFGVTNGLNVISNGLFLIAGIAGLKRVMKQKAFAEKYMWEFFYSCVILVGIGSAYYHLHPTNETLVWDRLPMTLAFSSLMACLVSERISLRIGKAAFVPLVIIGIYSVFYWWATEDVGAGDLRPYIIIQYLPMILLPFIILLFRKGRAWDRPYLFLLCGYVIAKIFEWQDKYIFAVTSGSISGHTLKHIAAALAIMIFQPCLTSFTNCPEKD